MKYFQLPTIIQHPQVIVSACKNVFSNLALEDWIYKNVKFVESKLSRVKPELFMLWRNDKCIVIGRHQNAWAEVNVRKAVQHNVDVARRRSGGGTVYHDLGNLNLTFFTTRGFYNRKRNLNFVASHLRREWKLDVVINSRDDLIVNDTFKISGTAAKLGSDIAYHHFTLLVDADLHNVDKLLNKDKEGLTSRATTSIPSPVLNLCDLRPTLTPEALIDSFVKAYTYVDADTKNILVDPTDNSAYPSIIQMHDELKQWGWIYGHTPKFSIDRHFAYPGIISPVHVQLQIDKGLISDILIDESSDEKFNRRYLPYVGSVSRKLSGLRYWLSDLERVLREMDARGEDDDDELLLSRWLVRNLTQTY
ncbi:hypothetical protein HELRODRAFT_185669 [Helobdella robusta]|uniref:BPL/LPL catalytic domain-containing protein n=1 Tax=Helobdella robusta TaxID=6412 RepID=T1FN43_HELRO|nr:hypothetical protein HELRODRAFT_185669 [Helobdella robusta]ESO03168.1 hypothetical protein HELRODRAFT_185669 [Helobdella robusta]